MLDDHVSHESRALMFSPDGSVLAGVWEHEVVLWPVFRHEDSR